MDNEYTYQEKEKSINNAFENKQINDYLQENEHMEAGYNMMEQKVDIYDQMANIQKTSQDVANISGILERMNLGTYEVEEKEVKIAKLEAIQGRMLSHLMLNDQKATGDSDEMDKVKNRLHELEVAMTAEQRHALGDKQIDYLQNLYEGAIEACRLYCKTKHPWLPAGKRRKAKVKATLARLMRESDCLELGRMIVNREGSEAASINSGLKLLSLTAVQNLADKMEGSKRRHNLRNKLEEDMQNLEKKSAEDEKNLAPDYMKYNEAMFLHDTKKATYDEAKKAYDELYERKEKVEKIGWFKLKFGGDEELDNAHANLKLLENEVDNAEVAVNDQLEKIKNFEKMHQDNSAKKEKLIADAKKDIEKVDDNIKKEREALKANAARAQEESVKDLDNKINALPADLQGLVRMISYGNMPSSLVKNKNKVTSAEKKSLSDLLVVRETLNTFTLGQMHSKTVTIAGKDVRFLQDEFGNAQIQYGKTKVPFAFNAGFTVSMIATDVMANRKLYGDGAVLGVLKDLKTDIPEMSRSDVIRTRDFSTQILFELLAVPKTLLNNFTSAALKQYSVRAFENRNNKEALANMKKKFIKIAESKNNAQKERNINTVLNQELQNAGINDTKNIELHLEEKEDKSNWDEREQKVRDLAADLIYSSDTWVADNLKKDPADRIKHVLIKNADAIAMIVCDQFRDKEKKPDGLVESMLEKLPLFYNSKEEEDEFKAHIAAELKGISDFINAQLEEEESEFVRNVAKNALKSGTIDLIKPKIVDILNNLDEEDMEKLREIDSDLGDKVDDTIDSVQSAFENFMNVIFEDDEEEEEEQKVEKKEEKKEEKVEKEEEEEKKEEKKEKDKYNQDNDDFLNENVDEVIKPKEIEGPDPAELERQDKAMADSLKEEGLDPQILANRKRQVELTLKQREDERKEAERQEADRVYNERKKYDKNRMKKSRKIIKDVSENVQKLETAVAIISKNITEMHIKDLDQYPEEEQIRMQEELQRKLDMENDKMEAYKKTITVLRSRVQKHKKFVDATEKKYRMQDLQRKIDARVGKIKSIEDEIKHTKAEKAAAQKELDNLEDDDERQNYLEHQVHEADTAISVLEGQLKDAQKNSTDELDTTLKDSIKGGKKGQSLFMKNVFKIYFKSMEKLDKRSMVASAIKNSQAGKKMTYEERKALSDDQILDNMSSALGGLFKGAGPLFQKMLQGLPLDSLPKGLRKAVEDTQDALASIPEEVIKAHMDGIRVRSGGKITKIDVEKSLGAASVGQAFLCKVYGPDIPAEGKKVVIKLLRPDVRNRMMREKSVMLEAAKMTDEDGMLPYEVAEKRKNKVVGGMEATYMGNLQRIEEELDLTVEAKNCKEGQVYDNPIYDKDAKAYKENVSDSMKLSDLAEATSDTCIMELAGSSTVKRFMSSVDDKITELLWDYCIKENELDKNGEKTGRVVLKRDNDGAFIFRDLSNEEKIKLKPIIEEVEKLLDTHEKAQKGVAQVVEKWVTEGIFEKGYYHGDLHAGNIMISEKGVTVIDFGNATILSSDQQKHIIKMMVAATMGDVERFRHGFHMLLENTPEEVYQAKRDELTLIFKDVMTMGDENSAAERIAVALVRAQEIGIELPPTIANFSSCQMRLQNTLSDVNKSLLRTRAQLKKIRAEYRFGNTHKEFDPVAQFIESTKTFSKAEKMGTVEANRLQRKEVTEEDFKKKLKNKDNRASFAKEFGLTNPLANHLVEKDLAKIKDVFDKKVVVTEKDRTRVQEENEEGTGVDYFTEIGEAASLFSDSNTDQANYLSRIANEAYRLIYDEEITRSAQMEKYGGFPNSYDEFIAKFEQLHSHLFKGNKIIQDLNTDEERKLAEYYKAQDNPDTEPAELERLENELWQLMKDKVTKDSPKRKYINKCKERFLPITDKESIDQTNRMNYFAGTGLNLLKGVISTSVINKTNGEQLKKAYDEYLVLFNQAVKENIHTKEFDEQLEAKYNEMMDLLWDAQMYTMEELSDTGRQTKIDNSELDNFLNIMGEVMRKKKFDVMWMLDKSVTVKMLWGLTKDAIKERLGIGEGE